MPRLSIIALSTAIFIALPCLLPTASATVDTDALALQELQTEEKLLHYRRSTPPAILPARRAPAKQPSHSTLQVQLSTEKSRYRVGEKIRFTVRGNRDFYLYLFNRDPKAKKWLSILPNRYQTKRQVKYVGGKSSIVPNLGLEFYADHPGKERITMVASERYLDVDKMQRISQAKQAGDYFEWADPVQSLKAAINESYGDQLGQEKLLQVRRSHNGGQETLHTDATPLNGLISKEFMLTIH